MQQADPDGQEQDAEIEIDATPKQGDQDVPDGADASQAEDQADDQNRCFGISTGRLKGSGGGVSIVDWLDIRLPTPFCRPTL